MTQRRMKVEAYRSLVDRICIPGSPQPWRDCLLQIPDLTIKQRKALANLARAQHVPDRDTQLYNQIIKSIPEFMIYLFSSMYSDPFSAGLLMSFLRLAPLSQDQIQHEYKLSMNKERKVMDETGLPSRLNYNVFFGHPNECIAPGIESNTEMARLVQESIDRWIRKIENTLLYPRLSKKTMERSTCIIARKIMNEIECSESSDVMISQVDVERIYHKTGYKVMGPCEMRQRWYTSQLNPRTYFSSGGTAFHSSKYIADIMVLLCDNLAPTNRRYRVNPTRLQLRPSSHAFIYDLSSFTSNLHEQCHFVNRLAEYCRGVTVNIVDSWNGVMQYDLGRLISEYNAVNIQGQYSLMRVNDQTETFLYHCTAGFLGVYGNIANATFLHGSVMLQLCQNTDQLNVAGDDGIIDSQNDEEAFELLRYLGLMEISKSFTTLEEGAIHLKRPIYQVSSNLIQGNLILWPSFEYILNNKTDIDPRYPLIREMTRRDWCDALSSSITGFLTSLTTITLESWMVDVVDSVLTHVYRKQELPLDGYVPQVHGNAYGFIPQYAKRFIGLEPKRNTIERSYQGVAKVPYRQLIADIEGSMEENTTFIANSSKGIRYCEDLGYLDKSILTQMVYGEEGLSMLLKEYFNPEPAIYEYRVLRPIPKWIIDLVRNIQPR
nr:MAG: RdRp [Downy mildew lesion associated ambivirus 3]